MILEDADTDLTVYSREIFADYYEQLLQLDQLIKEQDKRIAHLCQQNKLSQRFIDVPGIGPLTATIVATDLCQGKGTEATRASIIEVLLKRQFIIKQGKKHLVSSLQARALIDALPEPVKDPATTAVWEQALDNIAQGKGNADQFVQDQAKMVMRLTQQVKQSIPIAFKTLETNTEKFACPKCNHALARRKSKNGFFWGCRNYPECTVILPDDKGRPGKARVKAESTDKPCPECQTGKMIMRTIRKGKKTGKTFLGCNQYPECKHTEG